MPTMQDGNSLAERQRDAAEARREAFLPTREAARDSLVDLIMDGKRYPMQRVYPPRAAYPHISLRSILEAADRPNELYDELARIVCERDGDAAWRWSEVEGALTKIVREYLDGSTWADLRQQDMAAEAEEESGV